MKLSRPGAFLDVQVLFVTLGEGSVLILDMLQVYLSAGHTGHLFRSQILATTGSKASNVGRHLLCVAAGLFWPTSERPAALCYTLLQVLYDRPFPCDH